MFVTPAFAQAAGAAAPSMGAGDLLVQFAPILLLVVIFWLLIFRPQQKRMKAHQAMLSSISRGDTVVTTGGLVGKVTKVRRRRGPRGRDRAGHARQDRPLGRHRRPLEVDAGQRQQGPVRP